MRLLGDSSANHGMIQRQGAGKVKHLGVPQLWLQQQSELGTCVHEKVPRAVNYSDIATHYWARADGDSHLAGLSCRKPGEKQGQLGDSAGDRLGNATPEGGSKGRAPN